MRLSKTPKLTPDEDRKAYPDGSNMARDGYKVLSKAGGASGPDDYFGPPPKYRKPLADDAYIGPQQTPDDYN